VDEVTPGPELFQVAELIARRAAQGRPYLEFLRVPHLSAGLYVLSAGAADGQAPHTEDELYVVLSGKGQLRVGERSTPVGPGSLCFVQSNAPHAFHSVTEELRLLVVFGPAEGSPSSKPR
jgi:mannose-6-phosphate isomerase-like protein (cupin superfamily)